MKAVVFRPELPRVLIGLAWQRCTGKAPLLPGGPVALEEVAQKDLPTTTSVRVRRLLGGICGSDLNVLHLQYSRRSANFARPRSIKRPVCLGHEVVGRVIDVGPDVHAFRVGQRVVYLPGIACSALAKTPPCAMCEQGLPLLCLNRDEIHLDLADGGGWANEMTRDQSQWMAIPDEMSDEQAVLLEPLACSTHAVLRRLPPKQGSVIVIGCGSIGLGIILAVRVLCPGTRIIAVARHTRQADRARKAGAHLVVASSLKEAYPLIAEELGTRVLGTRSENRLLHEGADVIYDAVGSGQSLHHALRWAKPRGSVVIEGINVHSSKLDRSAIWLRELEVIGTHGHGRETHDGATKGTFGIVIQWVMEGRLNLEGMVTHRFGLRDYARAIRAAENKSASGALKVVLDSSLDD
jgi:threonine dehydrogenase-like Zn-dependent dehydrogenase